MKQNSSVPGQLALFTVAPTVETRVAVYDPYWDEIELAPQQVESPDIPEQLIPGDWVRLDQAWMDKCLKVAGKEWRKNYEYKSTEDLKAEVFLVNPAWKGGIYVSRNGKAVYVPREYYSVLKTDDLAPQHTDNDACGNPKGERWNPSHFGEVPRKADGDQLTIFYDDSDEAPDPDDYQNLDDYNCAWREWELRVGAQVTISTPVKPLVGAHVALDTKKVAPQHDTHWVEKYWVERSGNKYWYYRYCWMTGRKKHRRYLGSVDSPKARFKKEEIENAIADGQTPAEIEELIRSWRPQSQCPMPNA